MRLDSLYKHVNQKKAKACTPTLIEGRFTFVHNLWISFFEMLYAISFHGSTACQVELALGEIVDLREGREFILSWCFAYWGEVIQWWTMSFSRIFSHLKKSRTCSRNIDQVVLCTRSFNLLKNFKGVFELSFFVTLCQTLAWSLVMASLFLPSPIRK